VQCSQNIVTSNIITQTSGSGGNGILVGSFRVDNFLLGNITLDNETHDLTDNNASRDHNRWRDHTFRTSEPPPPNSCPLGKI
jgi:hypothetical protein